MPAGTPHWVPTMLKTTDPEPRICTSGASAGLGCLEAMGGQPIATPVPPGSNASSSLCVFNWQPGFKITSDQECTGVQRPKDAHNQSLSDSFYFPFFSLVFFSPARMVVVFKSARLREAVLDYAAANRVELFKLSDKSLLVITGISKALVYENGGSAAYFAFFPARDAPVTVRFAPVQPPRPAFVQLWLFQQQAAHPFHAARRAAPFPIRPALLPASRAAAAWASASRRALCGCTMRCSCCARSSACRCRTSRAARRASPSSTRMAL